MLRLTGVLAGAGLGLVLLLSGTGAAGQDKEKEPPVKVRGQLPSGWKKIGLSDDQIQKIYTVRGEYQAKISKLRAEENKLRQEERRAMFRVLTDDQKAKLRQLAEEKNTEPAPKEKQVEKK